LSVCADIYVFVCFSLAKEPVCHGQSNDLTYYGDRRTSKKNGLLLDILIGSVPDPFVFSRMTACHKKTSIERNKHSKHKTYNNRNMSNEKDKRMTMIEEEVDKILKETQLWVEKYLEEDFEKEAMDALRTAAKTLAYRKKYYDVTKDEIVYFPSISRLIMKNALQDEAETCYWEEEDEFPLEYSKALKTVVREQGLYEEDEEGNDEYMSKLAQDVDI
jgi:hypothetical protein